MRTFPQYPSRNYFIRYEPGDATATYQPAWTDRLKLVGLTESGNLYFMTGSGDLDTTPVELLEAYTSSVIKHEGHLLPRSDTLFTVGHMPPRKALQLLHFDGLLQIYDYRRASMMLMDRNPRRVIPSLDRYLSIPNGPIRTLSIIGEEHRLFIRIRPSSQPLRFKSNYMLVAETLARMHIKPLDLISAWDFNEAPATTYLAELRQMAQMSIGMLEPHRRSSHEMGTTIGLMPKDEEERVQPGTRIIARLCEKSLISPQDVRAAIDVFDLPTTHLQRFLVERPSPGRQR